MGGVLQYKWELYCDTNRRSTDSISLSSEHRGTKSPAIQIGGVLQYKLEVYCDTFSRSSGGWGFWRSSDSSCLSQGKIPWVDSGGALNPYILNQDISKWHFSLHGGVWTAPFLSRRRLPCLGRRLRCGIPLERAVRIDVSSANCRAKSHFQTSPFKMPPFRASWVDSALSLPSWFLWEATKEYLNQRGTKIRVFRVCFRTPFLPPFSPHFSPLFPLQALCILAPLLPSSPPPSALLFWLPEKSDLGTPLI